MSALILCGCVISISCTDNYKHDRSLTGSISYGYFTENEGIFDGVPLIDNDDYSNYGDFCEISKISETKVSFSCEAEFIESALSVRIPELFVSGKPYDVTFDYVSPDATVTHNDTEYNSVSTSIRGWMKSDWATTRASDADIAYPNYDCDIEIKCTIDGKELEFRITKLEGVG